MSRKPRWVSNRENRERERQKMNEAISNCGEGNFHAIPGLGKIQLFVERYGVSALTENYGVSKETYGSWVQTVASASPESVNDATNEALAKQATKHEEDNRICTGCGERNKHCIC